MSLSEKLGSDEKMVSHGQSKSKLIGVSLLVLSVLLTVAVASLIYLAVNNTSTASQVSASVKTDEIRKEVKVRTDDEEDVREDVRYDRSQHVAYYYGSDGSFEMDDFKKGIQITKANDGNCYVIPIGFNKSAERDIQEFVEDFEGKEADRETSKVVAQVFDGKIMDTSFIHPKAREQCQNGFQWMSVVPKAVDTEDIEESKELAREKRRTCRTLYIYCRFYRTIVNGRLVYRLRCFRVRLCR